MINTTTSIAERINLGFMPLTDAAPLIVAKELGLFAKRGLDVSLKRQNSWTVLKENLHLGILDCGQMLAPMPIESQLGLNGQQHSVIAPLILSKNGNAITIASKLLQEIAKEIDYQPALPLCASLLKNQIKRAKRKGRKLTFAVVYQYSCHYYQLLYWLKLGSVNPRDIDIVIISPSNMSAALAAGDIDGFCSGEPWNTIAVRSGVGYTGAVSADIWSNTPEKVLGLLSSYYQKNPQQVLALIAALIESCQWLEHIPNRFEAARLLSLPCYLNTELENIAPSLIGSCIVERGAEPRIVANYNQFYHHNDALANCPDKRDGERLLSYMLSAKHLDAKGARQCDVDLIYRSDIYRDAQRYDTAQASTIEQA